MKLAVCMFPTQLTEGLYLLLSADGDSLCCYIEASSSAEALARYRALPVRLREQEASSAVEVEEDNYVPGFKVFFGGYFRALGIA